MGAIGSPDPAAWVLLIVAGILAGAVNAVAGGGTFFTFPVLIYAGLPPLVANTTNMVALLPANLAALPAYRARLGALGRRTAGPLAIGLIGGSIGAALLLHLGAGIFAAAVPYLIGFATLLFATAPALRRAVQRFRPGGSQVQGLAAPAFLFALSIYGGYFGAGLGQVVLAALILSGTDDLHDANAMKNAMVFAVSLMAVFIFAAGGSVHWPVALVMMGASALGGFLGGALSQRVAPGRVRAGIIGFGVFLTLTYFVRA